MITTVWDITQLKRKPDTGLVTEVTYVMNFEHESKFYTHRENLKLTEDSESLNFIPYDDLTKEIIVQWVKDILGETRIQEIETDLLKFIQHEIHRKNNPEYLMGTPWLSE